MIIDLTFYGYGVGLVMVGWFVGMAANVALSTIGRMR